MFNDKSGTESFFFKPGISNVVEIAADEAKAKCLVEGDLRLGLLLLERLVQVKGLNTTLLSTGQICNNGNIIFFTKKNSVVVILRAGQMEQRNIVATAERCNNYGL